MCGIVGFANIKGGRTDHTYEISEMMRRQAHRGPDDAGIVGFCADAETSEELGRDEPCHKGYDGMMGFNRLSIRDLSMNGHQPMRSPDGRVIVSFNGEIYNSNCYQSELKRDGITFKSTTDTEVILYLYLKYGIREMAKRLNGMFGICICDLRSRKLFLVRDRVGIKPLYYTVTEKRFAYASEMKSFLGLHEFDVQLREEALVEHLTFFKPLNSILFAGVEQVMPGEIVEIQLSPFQVTCSSYFNIDSYVRPAKSERSMQEWIEKAREKLVSCVEGQKISDAKVGCQLSGGVDSSLVTYFAAGYGENQLRDCISIIFDGEEKGYSEEKYVDVVGEKLHLNMHKKVIDADYVLKHYEQVIWHGDSVVGRPNSIGLKLLTEEAKKYVTVLLSGEGSDELLGGYDMFVQGHDVRERLGVEGQLTVETVGKQPEVIKSFAEYAVIAQQKTNSSLCREVMPGYDEKPVIEKRIEQFNDFHGTDFDKQIKYTLCTYLPELLLCQDKMSMSNSIENRVPVLDNEFIDFAFSIPEEVLLAEKSGKWQGKYLLKEVCADLFGDDFSYRRKMGFGLPYYRYFQEKRFRNYFYELILPKMKERGILDARTVENWYAGLGRASWGEAELFWKACSFEVWCQLYMDRRDLVEI